MAFRDEYGRKMASTHCFHNWNLVADDRLEVDVLRRPVRLASWCDLIRMRFVRQGKDWKFDEVEWLDRRALVQARSRCALLTHAAKKRSFERRCADRDAEQPVRLLALSRRLSVRAGSG